MLIPYILLVVVTCGLKTIEIQNSFLRIRDNQADQKT